MPSSGARADSEEVLRRGDEVLKAQRTSTMRSTNGDTCAGQNEHIVCGICRNYRAARRRTCIRTSRAGEQRDHAFAEFVVVPETNVWVHDDTITPRLGAVSNPFADARRELSMKEGFDVGMGTFGHATALPEMIDNMNPAGQIAMRGLLASLIAID